MTPRLPPDDFAALLERLAGLSPRGQILVALNGAGTPCPYAAEELLCLVRRACETGTPLEVTVTFGLA